MNLEPVAGNVLIAVHRSVDGGLLAGTERPACVDQVMDLTFDGIGTIGEGHVAVD